MLIVADIGNTTVHLGLCDEGAIVRDDRVAVEGLGRGERPPAIVDALGRGTNFSVVMATVNPPARSPFANWSREVLGVSPLEVGRDIPVPIPVRVERPGDVGVDRLLNALSAYDRIGGACIVVDFGTAITLDVVAPDGAYVGGAIAPGLRLSAQALWDRAALIPPVEIVPTEAAIGQSTDEAVRIGVIQGALGLVDRLLGRVGSALGGDPRVVATGGDAELIAGLSDCIDEVIPRLTLDGIRIAWERSDRGEAIGA